MSKERRQLHTSELSRTFGFTEPEALNNRVSDRRFLEIIEDEETVIHDVEESTNNYGEFLFVTVSRAAGEKTLLVTFYGLGKHEYRERWYTDEWHFYRANGFPERMERRLSPEEAREQIQKRRVEITPYAREEPQSGRAKLYEMLADLTDEDGALVEIEDLGDAVDWLAGDSHSFLEDL